MMILILDSVATLNTLGAFSSVLVSELTMKNLSLVASQIFLSLFPFSS